MVSHDRYFIDQIADRVITLKDGRLESYNGNYSYYQEKIQAQNKVDMAARKEAARARSKPETEAREQQKEQQRLQRKKLRALEEIEQQITELEEQKSHIEILLSDPLTYGDEDKAREYTASYKHIEELLASAYTDWEILNLELEE